MPDDRRITVVSGFSKEGYEQYGRNFIYTFHKFAPDNLDLVIYVPEPVSMPRGRWFLHYELDGAEDFVLRHKNIPEHNGRAYVEGWRKKDERKGYCYRFDAVKFCWQLFYPEHAAKFLKDNDILVWFDGDVVFHNNISTSILDVHLQKAELVYLGRTTHSELGFWAIRLTPRTRAFLRAMADAYRTDRVFTLREWHSAFVFDYYRRALSLEESNLTPNDKGGVWERTELRRFSTHLKGRLKDGDIHGVLHIGESSEG